MHPAITLIILVERLNQFPHRFDQLLPSIIRQPHRHVAHRTAFAVLAGGLLAIPVILAMGLLAIPAARDKMTAEQKANALKAEC